jgi:hypothetical protein
LLICISSSSSSSSSHTHNVSMCFLFVIPNYSVVCTRQAKNLLRFEFWSQQMYLDWVTAIWGTSGLRINVVV